MNAIIWKRARLGDLASFTNGRAFKPEEWSTTGVPIIRIQNLNGGGAFNHFDGDYDPSVEVRPGDLLFGWSGSRGTSFGPRRWKGPLGVLNQHIFRVEPFDGVHKGFLYHLLRHVTARIEARAHGASGLVHIRKRDLIRISVVMPEEYGIQERFAQLLDWAELSGESLAKLITAKREFKRGLMQELLTGRRRFREFGAPSTAQGRPPEGWSRTSLGEVATIRVSNVDKHYRPEHIAVRLCNYMDVWTRPYICDDQEFMRSTASQREVELFQLRDGDVLLTKDSETREEIAEPSVVLSAGNDLVLGYHLALVRPDPDLVDGRFLAAQLRVPRFRQHFVRSAQGATRFGLTIDSLQRAEVWLPSVEEQRRIGELDLILYREIGMLEGLRDRFETERRGLMQKLLTGELTVPVSSEPEPVHV